MKSNFIKIAEINKLLKQIINDETPKPGISGIEKSEIIFKHNKYKE
jgi:hypothetical protein